MIILHSKAQIQAFLQQDVFLHLYSLGDLDDFFWGYTVWYASKADDEIKDIILLYAGQSLSVILAISGHSASMAKLLASIQHLLPNKFYAHLSPGVEKVLEARYHLRPHGLHYKMGLKDKTALSQVDTARVTRLAVENLDDILRLYAASYPGNWFDPRMLETKQYFGIREGHQLVSVAGIHVYSEAYKVAALGNITTHPSYRGRGYGRATTARLCQSLAERVDYIGLNVKTDNQTAISLYKSLGFEIVAEYNEYMVEAKRDYSMKN
jgi:ribosomal protein S18 acetylase RimI-like enzyme